MYGIRLRVRYYAGRVGVSYVSVESRRQENTWHYTEQRSIQNKGQQNRRKTSLL